MWEDCQRFVRKINKQMPGVRVMLPTEAQWEYACRAGNLGAFSGNDVDELAWHEEGHPAASTEGSFAEIDSWQPEKTWMKWGDPVPDDGWWHPHPVAGKKPNPWGFYDMQGNVRECTLDYFNSGNDSSDNIDPMGKVVPPTVTKTNEVVRCVRGGHWDVEARPCAFPYRNGSDKHKASYTINGCRFAWHFPYAPKLPPEE
jgi:formylglycine-generating enzyme required for sulfatase activity